MRSKGREYFREGIVGKEAFERLSSLDLDGIRGAALSSAFAQEPVDPDFGPMMAELSKVLGSTSVMAALTYRSLFTYASAEYKPVASPPLSAEETSLFRSFSECRHLRPRAWMRREGLCFAAGAR
jgi:hypothetical protein